MSNPIIKVENLSKAYRIGVKDQRHDTLGGKIGSWVKTPLKNFQRLKNLSSITPDNKDPDIFWALKDINFEVQQGEVLGIIGKNGAGKSTLLKILSRITDPTGGKVEIYGRVASLLEVGTGFNVELTGRENMYLNGTILGMKKKEIDRKFDEIIDFSGVEKFIDTPVKRYSSGMKVRLAFSVAAHLDPEILIIDEVLAVGDAEFQKKCLGKMNDIAEGEGRTVLFVSHDLTAVSSICTNALLLDRGEVMVNSSTQDVISAYLSAAQDGPHTIDFSKRKGDGALKISDIKFYPGRQIKSGAEIKVEFTFDRKLEREEINNLKLFLVFSNELRKKVVSVSNMYDKNIMVGNNSFDKITCIIPSFNLTAGRYYMDYWLSYRTGHSDELREFSFIDIIENDYFGTGAMPVGRKHGELIINQNWSVI